MSDDRDSRWADLLRRANKGDPVAYGLFLRDITPVIRGIVDRRARALPHEGEDIVQTILLAVHSKRATWRDGDPVAPWLFAIVRYKCVDAWRRRPPHVDTPVEDLADVLVDPGPGDVTAARDLDRLIEGLDPRSATILRAVGVEGASARVTGQRLNMSEGAVRVAFHRALARLRRTVAGPQNTDEDPPGRRHDSTADDGGTRRE
ncbi:MAG: sigma factor-like helix-turn-helix DNA-binding protein [Celeribacter sp.]|jgi:RNA polymerase sigma-70 factor (ECF subfamily)